MAYLLSCFATVRATPKPNTIQVLSKELEVRSELCILTCLSRSNDQSSRTQCEIISLEKEMLLLKKIDSLAR